MEHTVEKKIEFTLNLLHYNEDNTTVREDVKLSKEGANKLANFFIKINPEQSGGYKKDKTMIWITGSFEDKIIPYNIDNQ